MAISHYSQWRVAMMKEKTDCLHASEQSISHCLDASEQSISHCLDASEQSIFDWPGSPL